MKIKAIKIQHYLGAANPWNFEKEINVEEEEIETILMGNENEPTHWKGKQRIVLKRSWEEKQNLNYVIPPYIAKLLKKHLYGEK